MKIGWLIYDDDDYGGAPAFFTEEPESWRAGRVVQIVYAVILP